MEHSSYKEKLIRRLLGKFRPHKNYSEVEVTKIIRRALSESFDSKPKFSPDHLRVGLLELGCMKRTEDGTKYWTTEEELIKRENLKAILGEEYPIERINSVSHFIKKLDRMENKKNKD